MKVCFCTRLVQCIALYINLKRLIRKSPADLYVKVTRMLFPEEQISGGGFLSPQNRPINSLEVAEPSVISMNEPKQDGNINTSSVSLTLKPLSADITHVHCLPEPQTAGLSELVINLDVLLACSLTGLPVDG